MGSRKHSVFNLLVHEYFRNLCTLSCKLGVTINCSIQYLINPYEPLLLQKFGKTEIHLAGRRTKKLYNSITKKFFWLCSGFFYVLCLHYWKLSSMNGTAMKYYYRCKEKHGQPKTFCCQFTSAWVFH